MRNPWGADGEWTGAWSDSSDYWTQDYRDQVGATDANDGIFFIPFEDYLSHYSQTSISVSVGEGLAVTRHNYSDKSTMYLSFNIKKDQEHFALSVNQMGNRLGNWKP